MRVRIVRPSIFQVCVFALAALATTFATGFAHTQINYSNKIKSSVEVGLNQDGLNLMSEIVEKKVLKDIHGAVFGDTQSEVGSGIIVKLHRPQV